MGDEGLMTEAMCIIANVFQVDVDEIKDVVVMKKGMTNRSFRFSINGQKYIMRVPGEGTDRLISRRQEYEAYQQIQDIEISDEVLYFDPNNGYKITRYMDDVRTCDKDNWEEVSTCMNMLRQFHQQKYQTSEPFDLFEKIVAYENYWLEKTSVYPDYQ